MKPKLFWLLVFLSISAVFITSKISENKLLNNFEQSQGTILKIYFGGKGPTGIKFTFDGIKSSNKPILSCSISCKEEVRKRLKELQKYKFPVVYLPSHHINAEILLFESQYKKYDIEMPKELEEIIAELSICEK